MQPPLPQTLNFLQKLDFADEEVISLLPNGGGGKDGIMVLFRRGRYSTSLE